MDEGKVVVTGTPVVQTGPVVALKAYRKKPGKQHMHNGVELQDGDVVLLNQNQAKAFKDKLDPVDGSPFKVMSDKDLAHFEEQEANRRARRDVGPAVEAKDQPAPEAKDTKDKGGDEGKDKK